MPLGSASETQHEIYQTINLKGRSSTSVSEIKVTSEENLLEQKVLFRGK